jgi:hypothetical protein
MQKGANQYKRVFPRSGSKIRKHNLFYVTNFSMIDLKNPEVQTNLKLENLECYMHSSIKYGCGNKARSTSSSHAVALMQLIRVQNSSK